MLGEQRGNNREAVFFDAEDYRLYLALGADGPARRRAYRALFRASLPGETVEALRRATQGGWVLGSDKFAARIARMAGRRTAPLPTGRPRRAAEENRQGKLI
ncbi:hypothetical protein [Dongia sp.]|uniref:hypothetical protein n=1 Tax=Dongia sp. TaxID=1977262 RepID=UPI0035B14360